MYKINELSQIILGRQGENKATTVEIDVSEWLTEYPTADINILVMRNGDTAPYIAVTSVSNNVLSWVITVSDTQYSGRGKAEIRATVNDVVKKSATAVTYVAPSLEGEPSPTPPEPSQAWVNEVIAAKESIENMSATAEVDNNVGTPSVTVTKTIIDDHTNLDFDFKNLKGEKGDPAETDQHYDPTSENAQSGKAVAEAVEPKQDFFGEVLADNVITGMHFVFTDSIPQSDAQPENSGDLTTKSYVDTEIENHHDNTKADKSTTYTKTEVDSALSAKANSADVYTKSQTDTLLNDKANADSVYTKTQTDTLFDGKENIIRDITPYVDYTLDSNTNEVTITNLKSGVTPSSLVGRFRIPDTITIDGVARTVTTIGGTCFYNCVNADFILPSTLTIIEDGTSYSKGAFSNTKITNANPNPNMYVGIGAFSNCKNITSLHIPYGVTISYGSYFACTNIKEIIIDEGITSIAQDGLSRNPSLYYVHLPETLTTLDQSVFNNCTGIKKLYLPKALTAINPTNTFFGITLTDLYFGGTQEEWNNAAHNTVRAVFEAMAGITIHYNCKPAIMQDVYDYHDSTKQDKLTAGTNITIDENNVISASGGGGTVDQTYDPTSTNAQSGTAVAEAVENKLTEPSSGLAVGKYFRIASIDADGHAVLECVDAPTAPVQSISAAGTALTPDANGNVAMPIVANNVLGLAKVSDANGGIAAYQGIIYVKSATNRSITNRSIQFGGGYGGIVPSNIDFAVKAAMCDGIGAAWTDAERLAALLRMGCTVDSNGFVKWTAQT